MNILHIGKYYFPSAGGIETISQNLAEGLVASGHDVTFLCFSDDGNYKEEKINNVKVIRLSHFGIFFSQPVSFLLPIWILKNHKLFDLFHFHTPNPLAEIMALFLPRKIPIIISYHSDIVRQKFLLKFYTPLQNLFLKRSNMIVVATENHINYSQFLVSYKSKCRVISYGLQNKFSVTNSLQKRADEIKKIFGKYIFFVGRLVSYKGVEYLIRAMKFLDITCVIAGDGPLKNDLIKLSEKLELSQKIKFIGAINDEEALKALYLGCELFVLPSITKAEAFGIVMIEAMAFGRPVVSTILPSGVRAVNEHEVTGLEVRPADVNDLADKISKLISNTELRERYGRNAKNKFYSKYTQDKMIEHYIQLYQELIES